jgi:hypothetical protein
LRQKYIQRSLHLDLDRRAADLARVAGDDDALLTPKQLAQWLGVSDQWVAIGRCRGYGPPFVKVAPMTVRYHRGAVRRCSTSGPSSRPRATSEREPWRNDQVPPH